jgi:hypothetical protein
MYRAVVVAGLLGLVVARPLCAQETLPPADTSRASPNQQPCPVPECVCSPDAQVSTAEGVPLAKEFDWRTAWGLLGIRIIPAGPRIAPNGNEYHPNFSMDVNINCWVWRSERVYLFADMRFWGEKGELGVTNARDGALGTSKREFDMSGGVAWNYAGPWEARVFGYSWNNLNRGDNPVTPAGFNDGFALENRYYLSPEYDKLGQAGFDVARATFLSFGYYPSKEMMGNDGRLFKPGLLLRAYVIQDLWDWPAYAFADVQYISENNLHPKLLLWDVGLAVRPFHSCKQWEVRFGVENTADIHRGNNNSLWYGSLRYIF